MLNGEFYMRGQFALKIYDFKCVTSASPKRHVKIIPETWKKRRAPIFRINRK